MTAYLSEIDDVLYSKLESWRYGSAGVATDDLLQLAHVLVNKIL